ncbi:MAG: hypothetical protein WCY48_07550 [Candidatus Caldatribacteriota bacterium]
MQDWTPEGWELLKTVAFNSYKKSGFPSTARKVIQDAQDLTERVKRFPESGTKIKNVKGQDRYYSVFNLGKVAIWKIEEGSPVFVGAFSSLPNPLPI